MEKHPIIEVTWLDAAKEDAYLPPSAIYIHPIERKSTGYLLSDEGDKIIIAYGLLYNLDKDDIAYDGVQVIPKPVKQIRIIEK